VGEGRKLGSARARRIHPISSPSYAHAHRLRWTHCPQRGDAVIRPRQYELHKPRYTRFRRPRSASLHVNGIYVRRRLVIALTGVASLLKLNRRGLIDPWQRRCNPGHSSCEVLLLLLTASELVLPTSSLAGQTSTLCGIPSVKRCSLSYSTSKVVLPCFFFVCAHEMPSGCKPVYL
jgi:hypothetical protein